MLCKIEISNAVHGSDSDYCTVVLVDDVFGRLPELHDVPVSQLYKYLETSTEEMVCNFSLGADTNRFEMVDGSPFSEHAKSVQDILRCVFEGFKAYDREGDSIYGHSYGNNVVFVVRGRFCCVPQVIECDDGVRANLFLYGGDVEEGGLGAAIYCIPDQGFMVLSECLGDYDHTGCGWGYVESLLSEDAARALVTPVSAGVGWRFKDVRVTGVRVPDHFGGFERGCKNVVAYTYEKDGADCVVLAYTDASGVLWCYADDYSTEYYANAYSKKCYVSDLESLWLSDDARCRYEHYLSELNKGEPFSDAVDEPFSGPVGDLEGLDVEAIQRDMQWAHDKLIRRINETYRVLNMYCDVGKGEPGLIVHSGDYVSYGVDASGYPLGQYEIIDADLNDTFHELGFDEIVLCGADKDHVGCHKTSDESLTVYVDLAADYVRGFKSHIGKR